MGACHIPLAVYRRLWLLYLIERFSQACYGNVRLQKVAYFSEKGQQLRPFTFKKAPRGPYSEDLKEILEQLLSMGLVVAEPLGETGNKYRVTETREGPSRHARWLGAVSASVKAAIESAVEQYGYMRQDSLVDAGHQVDGFDDASFYDVLLEANAPESVAVGLDEDECEELALSLSPGFVGMLRCLADTDWASSLDKVRLIEAG